MGPHPAVADVRRAVRQALGDLAQGDLVLVACSGGADSLALAAALAFTAPRMGLRAGLVTVDHGLQEGSGERAAKVAGMPFGLDPAEVLTVVVGSEGGPEAAARRARYEALDGAAGRLGAKAVLLGHTRDDQAETVLLGLARGSGLRSLSGMAGVQGLYRRPFLELGRKTTVAACGQLGLEVWADPHNEEHRFTRVRVRRTVLPVLESELGPGVAEALARTARLARDDADALNEWAEKAFADCALSDIPGKVTLAVPELEGLPGAVRRRVIKRAAIDAGVPSGALSAVHVHAVERLVTEWRGQKGVDLPGGLTAVRRYGTLILAISPIP
ncbi:tRNA lysidine(34) synthetase TilS [Nonomuraea sp. NPDC050790]|uniref:tRNA lysidine(34) synthetase TilS n=1 Tax=Nonomuraea sp. NPDC050790 TaxID=3364371 RepID=UPI00378D8617